MEEARPDIPGRWLMAGLLSIVGSISVAMGSYVGSKINDFDIKLTQVQGELTQIRLISNVQMETAIARLSKNENYIEQVWPRLRTNGENIELIAREIKIHHPDSDIKLKQPSKF